MQCVVHKCYVTFLCMCASLRQWGQRKASAVREDLPQEKDTWKTKTAGKATGNHPGKYVIHETKYAAAPFCDVDMSSRPLTWSITPRCDVKNVINLLVTAED